jgi:hypothetical protein
LSKLSAFAARFRPLLGAICLLAASVPAHGGGPADAGQVKAAFILNFLKFVEWPSAGARTPITVAVVGDEAFGTVLAKAAAGQSHNGRPIEVRSAARVADAGDAALLFIGASQVRNLPSILRETEGRPVLTVGDTDGYGEAGVILNLYTFDQRVRIEANTTAAARAGLRLSSQLLRLARIVG